MFDTVPFTRTSGEWINVREITRNLVSAVLAPHVREAQKNRCCAVRPSMSGLFARKGIEQGHVRDTQAAIVGRIFPSVSLPFSFQPGERCSSRIDP
jgi:hypothetical protein